ncbi:MAG: hypothetical protein J6M27_13800 [Lachnospiraceae bacterium]|nr:hypothetical protein [Lachnospiraceae bacterium]
MENQFPIETILEGDNIRESIEHLKKKKTGCGYDGMFGTQLPDFWRKNGEKIKAQIQNGEYIPIPAVQIRRRKPNGGIRLIEIPSVRDRMLQYAMCRVMQPYYEGVFSVRSFGFRTGRSTLDAVGLCAREMNEGGIYAADLDIKSYFDRVDQRKLMSLLMQDTDDPATLGLISSYLGMRVMSGCHVFRKVVGLPQGGPISPLLANVYLDQLDRFMEKADLHFIRYADDIVILCGGEGEAKETMRRVEEFLNDSLGLWLNREKSKLIPAEELHFLGYGFGCCDGRYYATIGATEWEKMKKVMFHNIQKGDENLIRWWDRLGAYNRGWINYYRNVPLEFLECYTRAMDAAEMEKIHQKCAKHPELYETALIESKAFIAPLEWYGVVKERYGKNSGEI